MKISSAIPQAKDPKIIPARRPLLIPDFLGLRTTATLSKIVVMLKNY